MRDGELKVKDEWLKDRNQPKMIDDSTGYKMGSDRSLKMDNTKYGMYQSNYEIDSKTCMLDENTRYKLVDGQRRHWGQIRGRYVTACRSYILSCINQSNNQINQLFNNQYRSVIITNYSYVKV